jgi:hypothetical protein
MSVEPSEQPALSSVADDENAVQYLDTTNLTVAEWEAIKTQFSRAGWYFAPHVAVFIRLSDAPTA